MSTNPKTLIVVAGPTAVGKTAIAIQLAQQLGTEIISADSRQCYVGMAIGTAQPDATERAQVVHHFIDCYEPETLLSAADFERIALAQLLQLFQTKDTVVLCGGTGLYIKALCEGLDEMPAVDPIINSSIHDQYQALGIDWLRDMLQKEDPVFFESGETENPARMLRALIFKLSTGQSITAFRSGNKKQRPFNIIKIGLELPRETLYNRINSRVDIMMQQGLMDEAKALYPKRHLKNLNTVGYTELFDFMDAKMSLPQAVDKIKQHSRNYAKRQLTWFKKDPDFHWFAPNEPELLDKIVALL